MRAIIEPAEGVPGLFNVYVLDTGQEFRDLGVRQVEYVIRKYGLVPA